MNLLVASRRRPPAPLARAEVHGDIGLLQAPELFLTEAETLALGKRRRARADTVQGDLERIHTTTGGWPAGVALLLRSDRSRAAPRLEAGTEAQPLFDYLASAVFSELGPDAQRILVCTSCLPAFNARQACELTGIDSARDELLSLCRSGLLLEGGDGEEAFRYHPLLRAFLDDRVKRTLSAEERRSLRTRAAKLLEQDDRADEAFDLLLGNDDPEQLREHVLRHAPGLVAKGRVTLLERWIGALPSALVESDGWLSYWLAMSRLTTAPSRSEGAFARALDCFLARRDGTGAYLAWAGGAQALTYGGRAWSSIESWRERLSDIECFCPVFPSADVGALVANSLLMGLALAGADQVKVEQWADRALSLANNAGDATVRAMTASVLLLNYALNGDSGRASVLSAKLAQEAVSASPAGLVAQVAAKGATAALAWHRADYAAGVASAREGFALMGSQHVPMWSAALLAFGGFCAIELGDFPQAHRFGQSLREIAGSGTPLEVSAYHAVRAREALVRGELAKALTAMDLSLDNAQAIGFPYAAAGCLVSIAYLAFELGQPERCREALAAAKRIEQDVPNPLSTYNRLTNEAHLALRAGNRQAALEPIREAFSLGREWQVFSAFGVPRAGMADLADLALRERIEVDYTRTLIRRRRLVPSQPPLDVPNWPWPIQARLLGPFELLLDGTTAPPGRSRMPPLLFKAIVGLARRDGSVPVEEVIAALWPDTDGDTGAQTFGVTLLRLRKALGPLGHEAIRLENGRLSLDRSICWTDIDALDCLLAKVERASPSERQPLALALEALYRGPFADDGDLPPELLGFRQRMRTKVAAAARSLDTAGSKLCQHLVAVDRQLEELLDLRR